jgi:hypothetical protein
MKINFQDISGTAFFSSINGTTLEITSSGEFSQVQYSFFYSSFSFVTPQLTVLYEYIDFNSDFFTKSSILALDIWVSLILSLP